MKFAGRISRISVSQTMAVNEKALQMRAQGIDIVDFGAGEPDFPTPENIKQAGIRAIESNFTRYTSIGGTPDLRKAIVEHHAQIFGSKFDVAQCLVNAGGKHAIFNAASAVVDDGDDVVGVAHERLERSRRHAQCVESGREQQGVAARTSQ